MENTVRSLCSHSLDACDIHSPSTQEIMKNLQRSSQEMHSQKSHADSINDDIPLHKISSIKEVQSQNKKTQNRINIPQKNLPLNKRTYPLEKQLMENSMNKSPKAKKIKVSKKMKSKKPSKSRPVVEASSSKFLEKVNLYIENLTQNGIEETDVQRPTVVKGGRSKKKKTSKNLAQANLDVEKLAKNKPTSSKKSNPISENISRTNSDKSKRVTEQIVPLSEVDAQEIHVAKKTSKLNKPRAKKGHSKHPLENTGTKLRNRAKANEDDIRAIKLNTNTWETELVPEEGKTYFLIMKLSV